MFKHALFRKHPTLHGLLPDTDTKQSSSKNSPPFTRTSPAISTLTKSKSSKAPSTRQT
jgi:hypothetical protein